jgi:hypothetical protein
MFSMRFQAIGFTVFLIAGLTIFGCEKGPAPAKQQSNPAAPPTGVLPTATKSPSSTVEQRAVAETGVGAKGKSYGGGIITEPASQYWKLKEKIVFEISIPHAMNLFKATEGKGPKSNAEFMQKIVAENNIVLPDLPEGRSYKYEPSDETLYVVWQEAAGEQSIPR